MEIFPSHTIHDISTSARIEQSHGVVSRFKQLFFKPSNPASVTQQQRGPRTRPLALTVAQRTDVGRKRQHNEDSVAYIIPKDQQLLENKGALFIVADGMGGHAAGEVASEIAVDTVCTLYYQDADTDIPTSLRRAIQYANATIYQRATENTEHSGMGTTCVVAVLRGKTAYVANVGDSRAYMVRKGHVRQISQDHSWVAEQVRMGQMSEEEAQSHSMRNIITRSLGPFPEVEVDIFVEPVEEGDAFVLCSDGLCGMLNDNEITSIVEQFGPQESVYRLVEYANAQGGIDNITAIVARVNQR
ncbi:Stp1/IreP family PP2C-type Ser/Thr phosphatase [Dictyobacter arantiisoli]|uniref:Protein phosphatase n=1 Tax=Dictyobacter arantiisoli TaxID=2014874 RepID=A0A5A5T7G2_9CHLR|nr:Stp1/IreP family PP2C-type Ser/Thr phosphatase [Dictyobacter arantiisoli]GCF06943.1 protein phosphatase [Dictyobacter arantiisoli]